MGGLGEHTPQVSRGDEKTEEEKKWKMEKGHFARSKKNGGTLVVNWVCITKASGIESPTREVQTIKRETRGVGDSPSARKNYVKKERVRQLPAPNEGVVKNRKGMQRGNGLTSVQKEKNKNEEVHLVTA